MQYLGKTVFYRLLYIAYAILYFHKTIKQRKLMSLKSGGGFEGARKGQLHHWSNNVNSTYLSKL